MTDSQLRICLGRACLVSTGFRLQVAGKPSLELDGDLLWAVDRRLWVPLAVDCRQDGTVVLVTPKPLDQQVSFDPQQVLRWRDDPVRLCQNRDITGIREALVWRRMMVSPVSAESAWTVFDYPWGRLLRLELAEGYEYLLLPESGGCLYLGYLALDWPSARIEYLND